MTKKIHNLHELFIDQLRDLYDSEHRILQALPKMQRAAHCEELQQAFGHHRAQTEEHIRRLDKVFYSIDEKPARKQCKAIRGILEEGEETLKELMEMHVHDAALIAAAQRVEHYEIAVYGSVRAFAELMQHSEAVDLLDETLQEEKDTDQLLSRIAQDHVNMDAMDVPEAEQREMAHAG